MCRYTAYVHVCDHLATGPILSNPCSFGCGLGPVYGDTMRTDLGVPYRIREGMTVDYIMIDSLCCGCQLERDPFEDVEIPGAAEMIWHVPSVMCLEEFRPIDFGAAVEPEADESNNVSATMSPYDTSTNTDSWSLIEEPHVEFALEGYTDVNENESAQRDVSEKQNTKSPIFDLHTFLHEPMTEAKVKARKEKRASRQHKKANQIPLRLSTLQAPNPHKPEMTILQRRGMKRLNRGALHGYTTEPALIRDLRVYTNIHIDIGEATQGDTIVESDSAVLVSKPSPVSAAKPSFGYHVIDTALQPAPLNLRKIMRKQAINKLKNFTNEKQNQSPDGSESDYDNSDGGISSNTGSSSNQSSRTTDFVMEFDHLYSYL